MEAVKNPQDSLTSKDYYFDSYSHYGIHEEMLKDGVRTKTYMNSILRNEHFFKDKAVLDVGCGTGILSMFAAQAGARAVYAVDMSSIAHQASEIVTENGFKDVITVMQCKMEDAALPEKVDIIISEWMGYALYYESMLPTVLLARDKWLKPGGIILPDRSELKIAGIEDEDYKKIAPHWRQETDIATMPKMCNRMSMYVEYNSGHLARWRSVYVFAGKMLHPYPNLLHVGKWTSHQYDKIEFWENVFGFSMRPIKSLALQEPLVDSVSHECVSTTTGKLISIDINKMTADDIPFDCEFKLSATRNDHIHALCLWFDVFFDYSHKPLSFSTSPFTKQTHWKQTVFYLRDTLTVCKDEVIRGRLKCTPNSSNPRDLDFELEYQFCGKHCESSARLQYRMR